MLTNLYNFMQQEPVLLFFLVLGLGYLIGNFRVFGISLGSVGGVLLSGLIFGHLGFSMYAGIQSFGFALFIFCVGYQAGPRFFDVLLTSGLKYLSLAVVVAATGFGLAVWLANVLDFAPGMAAGLMGGAMTTTPTLAAAQDAVNSGLFTAPAGVTNEQVLTNIGAAYALTYLFGLIGLILIIRLLPKLLHIDLPAEAAKLMTGDNPEAGPDLSKVTRRAYRVTSPENLHLSVVDIERFAPKDLLSIVAIRRGGEQIPVQYDTHLEIDDEVLVIGQVDHLLQHADKFGEEISDEEGLSLPMTTVRVVVINPKIVGHPVSDIRLDEHVGALPLEIRRQRRLLPLSADLELHRGDVITVHGPEFAIERLARHVGYVERDVVETDLLTFSLGIAAGIGLGSIAVTIGGVTIGMGTAGGLLLTGLLIGFLRSVWPVFGRVPSAARWVFMELGLLMFMAGVGINAGGGIVEIFQSAGGKLIGAGIMVTLIPVLVGYFFSRKILKLNPAEALGGVTGAMTSGAALSVVNAAAESDAPSLGYTGAYAFANVILTLAGTLIMLT
jgi:putative transport protein